MRQLAAAMWRGVLLSLSPAFRSAPCLRSLSASSASPLGAAAEEEVEQVDVESLGCVKQRSVAVVVNHVRIRTAGEQDGG